VDDNEVNRKVMGRFFSTIGFESDIVKSGEEAVGYIATAQPGSVDIIFMDICMPGIGGLEAIKRIRNVIYNWKVPPVIVACTADVSQEIMLKCELLGVTEFVYKPINKKEIEILYEHLMYRNQKI